MPEEARERVPAQSADWPAVESDSMAEAAADAADTSAEPEHVAASADDDSDVAALDRAPTVEWTRTLEDAPAAPASDAGAEVAPDGEVEPADGPMEWSGLLPESVSTPDPAGATEPDEATLAAADWSAATDYPLDDLGFPSVPPGYEFALDEAPREGGAHADERQGTGPDAGRNDPPSVLASSTDRAAEVLETLAAKLRRGDLRLPERMHLDRPASVLAGLLVAVLADDASPGQDH